MEYAKIEIQKLEIVTKVVMAVSEAELDHWFKTFSKDQGALAQAFNGNSGEAIFGATSKSAGDVELTQAFINGNVIILKPDGNAAVVPLPSVERVPDPVPAVTPFLAKLTREDISGIPMPANDVGTVSGVTAIEAEDYTDAESTFAKIWPKDTGDSRVGKDIAYNEKRALTLVWKAIDRSRHIRVVDVGKGMGRSKYVTLTRRVPNNGKPTTVKCSVMLAVSPGKNIRNKRLVKRPERPLRFNADLDILKRENVDWVVVGDVARHEVYLVSTHYIESHGKKNFTLINDPRGFTFDHLVVKMFQQGH